MVLESIEKRYQVAGRLSRLPRKIKRFVMVVADSVMVPLALLCAFVLRFGDLSTPLAELWWLLPLSAVISVPIFAMLGLYRAVVRFMGPRVVYAVLKGMTLSTLLLALIAFVALSRGANVVSTSAVFSALIVFWALGLLYIGGTRFIVRGYLQRQRRPADRVAIYGAGEAGVRLASALIGGQEFVPVAFVDDNRTLAGSVINGIEVYDPRAIARLIEELEVSRVLLALPSVSRRRRRSILQRLEKLPVHVQTMPNFSDLISGQARVDDLREVDVADLLGRDTVPPNEKMLEASVRNKAVMVTGAGGSIGSELCRQILRLAPTRIVIFEISEPALYNIKKELDFVACRDDLDVDIVALLGSVQNEQKVLEVIRSFSIDTFYHAAAYKHVPIVEHNMIEGLQNNVVGTLNAARAAIEGHVDTFVLVSTDKAVCPTNVMGATKRLAELVLQGLHQRGTNTRFCMVRFGNVLESSGSVVPLFREQIRRGGPVTVTHPEIIRYFMTIPEAAQLVIQAGSMAAGGDVFVLDMAKPVKIADLARRMIHLTGLSVRDEENPDGDIDIEYTGLRPAEKLYEELLIGNNVAGTEHPRILRAQEGALTWSQLEVFLDGLKAASDELDCATVRLLLVRAVEEYVPAKEIRDIVWRQHSTMLREKEVAEKVTKLPTKRVQ